MPHMYCEMQNKLSNTRGSPLGSMGEIISSRCPLGVSGYDFQNILHFFCLKIFLTVTNSVDSNEMWHFVWVLTLLKYPLGVSCIQRANKNGLLILFS